MRNLLFGYVSGVLLSLLRVAPWSSPHDMPALGPWSARLGTLLGLGAIAAGLTRCSRGLATTSAGALLATGTVLGFATHALVLGPWLSLESRLAAVLVAAAGALLLALLAGMGSGESNRQNRAGAIELGGVFVAACGLALGISALWRPVALLTLGEPDELRVVALVLLAAATVGALAFGRLTSGLGRGALPLGLWLGAAGCLVGLWALQPLSGRDGLDRFLQAYGLELSLVGTLRADGLVAARAWIAPGLLLGTALAGLRGRGPSLALVAGLAAGVAAAVPALDHLGAQASPDLELATRRLLPLALGLAAAGGALGLLGQRAPRSGSANDTQPPSRARWAGLGAGVAVSVGAWLLPLHAEANFLSPWQRFPPEPSLLVETAEGVYTIENSPRGGQVLMLNRRELTPNTRMAGVEEKLFEAARLLLPPERRRSPRVLLVGQLDATRDGALQFLGAAKVDRTGTWHDRMPAFERALLDRKPSSPGLILAPGEAFEDVAAGRYDLVLLPPVDGTPPTLPPWDVPAETVAVAWLPPNSYVADRTWSEAVLVHADPLGGLNVGVLAQAGELPADAPHPVPTGPRVRKPCAWKWLGEREFFRLTAARVATAERLSTGAQGTDLEALTRGLLAHYAAQRHSSPWDTLAQSTEVDDAALATMSAAALSNIDDWSVRRLWEDLARLLVERREIGEVFEFVEPLADAGAPWPELDRQLARAELERLAPERAAWRMLRVIEENPYDLGIRAACANAMLQAQDPQGAVEQLDAIYAIQPQRPDLDRLYAIALTRAGDPRARERVEAWLEAHPDDEGMRVYLGAGPFPPIEPSFAPADSFDDHEGHQQGDGHDH